MKPTTPTWGSWVTHYDLVGQAPTMVASFNDGKTILSLLFDRMELSLQGEDTRLAGSIVLAGHFPITLPDEFPFRGFLLVGMGKGFKSVSASAVLTVSIGRSARTFEWPPTSKIIDVSGGGPGTQIDTNEFDISFECFSGDDHLAIGSPPKFPPIAPLTVGIGLHARRRSVEDTILVGLSNIEIAMLAFPPG